MQQSSFLNSVFHRNDAKVAKKIISETNLITAETQAMLNRPYKLDNRVCGVITKINILLCVLCVFAVS
jgi:predicted N-formylglutamate amidohydrolase